MKAFRRPEVEEIYVKILEDIYKESIATIKLHKVSDKIPIQKGVRLGNTISSKQFMVVLRTILRTWNGKSQECR